MPSLINCLCLPPPLYPLPPGEGIIFVGRSLHGPSVFLKEFHANNQSLSSEAGFEGHSVQNHALSFIETGRLLYSSGQENLHFLLQGMVIGFHHEARRAQRIWFQCSGFSFYIFFLTPDPPPAENLKPNKVREGLRRGVRLLSALRRASYPLQKQPALRA